MTDWTKKPIVPRANLQAWHQYEAGVSANNLINDYSGNSRHLTCASSGAPVMTLNVLNGEPGWNFNGSANFLNYTGTLTAAHIFILASGEDATFSTYRGLLSDSAPNSILVGDSGTDKFFDFSASFNSEYRKADVVFAANNQKAPVSNVPLLIEVRINSGLGSLDGIQIGQQVNLTARKWKGYFFEELIYSTVQSELARFRIYQYFAMRYKIWPKNAAGLNIFPFASNKTRSAERAKEHYISEPYSGAEKSLVRGSFRGKYQMPYLLREQAEFEAAQAFYEAHSPINDFVMRDYRYYPYKEVKGRFNSPLSEQGSDVTHRFNYTFDFLETS